MGQRPEHTCLVLQEFVAGLASDKASSSLAALPGIIPAISLPLWLPHMQQVSPDFHSRHPLQESGDMGSKLLGSQYIKHVSKYTKRMSDGEFRPAADEPHERGGSSGCGGGTM